MSLQQTGNIQNSATIAEHIDEAGLGNGAKRVGLYGYDPVNNTWRRINVGPDGALGGSIGATPLTGHASVAVTNTAVALSTTQTVKNGVIVQALSTNGANVWVGGSGVTSANGYELQAGQATSVAVTDISFLFVNGTAGDGVCFISST